MSHDLVQLTSDRFDLGVNFLNLVLSRFLATFVLPARFSFLRLLFKASTVLWFVFFITSVFIDSNFEVTPACDLLWLRSLLPVSIFLLATLLGLFELSSSILNCWYSFLVYRFSILIYFNSIFLIFHSLLVANLIFLFWSFRTFPFERIYELVSFSFLGGPFLKVTKIIFALCHFISLFITSIFLLPLLFFLWTISDIDFGISTTKKRC